LSLKPTDSPKASTVRASTDVGQTRSSVARRAEHSGGRLALARRPPWLPHHPTAISNTARSRCAFERGLQPVGQQPIWVPMPVDGLVLRRAQRAGFVARRPALGMAGDTTARACGILGRMKDLAEDRVSRTTVPALLAGVSTRGVRTITAGGKTPVTKSSAYRIASLTKPFTSAATVLALRERGIPLSTPAIELLPSLARDWRADPAITVEQLLGQIAGLRESLDGAAVAVLGDGPDAIQQCARLVVRAGNERAPGERWSYYNGNYFLVGAILAGVTGVSYEDALAQALLHPWGLTRTGFETPGDVVEGWDGQMSLPAGAYPRGRRPSGGLWSCMDDLLGFAEHLLNHAVLLAETRRSRTRADDPASYGLGWSIGPSGQMYLNGRLPGYRTAAVLIPDHGYASFALANCTDALPEIANLLSDLQHPFTGDDLATQIDAFAA
jgi:D-alanyl-D-alanine carboxypeptidase